MRKIHYSKAYLIATPTIIIISWLLFPIITGEMAIPPDKHPILIRCILALTVIMLWYSQLLLPLCLIECDNGFYVINQLQKRFKRDYIRYSSISKIEYPYWRVEGDDRTRSMRFELNDGSEYLCYDYFTNLSGLIRRWQSYKSIVEDDITNNYKPNGRSLTISPNYLAKTNTYLILMGIIVCILGVWRIITSPSWPYPYIVIPIMIATIYALCIPLKQVKVEDDTLKLRGVVARNLKYDIPLSKIGWIKIQSDSICVKETDQNVTNVKHSLSHKQVGLLIDYMKECGIVCESAKYGKT